MRNRRCVSAEVVETDAFYSMPASAQALYLHLCLLADDDGFVSNAELALRRLKNGRGCSQNSHREALYWPLKRFT